MLYKFLAIAGLAATLACVSPNNQPEKAISQMKFHDLTFLDIQGKSRSMSEFKGRQVLIVNTASECGYTPQYKDLQALHQKYGSRITVIGFPCNDFGGQEPGNEKAIDEFCTKNYGVEFLMASKVSIKGPNRHPVYRWLMSKSLNGLSDAEVRWNFTKFLVNAEGQWLASFPSSVSPLDPQITGELR
jgi:glutathione peroxidase